jgi:hypothetical protein
LYTEVAALKQRPGRDILVLASRKLWNDLPVHDLVDELHLMIMPVIAGEGDAAIHGSPARASQAHRHSHLARLWQHPRLLSSGSNVVVSDLLLPCQPAVAPGPSLPSTIAEPAQQLKIRVIRTRVFQGTILCLFYLYYMHRSRRHEVGANRVVHGKEVGQTASTGYLALDHTQPKN